MVDVYLFYIQLVSFIDQDRNIDLSTECEWAD